MQKFTLAFFFYILFHSTVYAQTTLNEHEEFAFSENRQAVLDKLVPGTKNYYFLNLLNAQHTNQIEKAKKLITEWEDSPPAIKDHRLLNIFKLRQALLENNTDTWPILKDYFNLRFDQIKQLREKNPNYKSELTYSKEIIRNDLNDLINANKNHVTRYITPLMYEEILNTKNIDTIRNDILYMLKIPYVENLPELISKHLDERQQIKFGDLDIHKNLTIDQMLKFKDIASDKVNEEFHLLYLKKILPNGAWRKDPIESQKYFLKAWEYTKDLAPKFNTIKASILEQLLKAYQETNVYPKDLFLSYLALPRERVWYKNNHDKLIIGDLVKSTQELNKKLALDSIVNEETLVENYLHKILRTEKSPKIFEPFFHKDWLENKWAEVQILYNLASLDEIHKTIKPDLYQSILNRQELIVLPHSSKKYKEAEKPVVHLAIKNTKDLIVKIYQINSLEFSKKNDGNLYENMETDGYLPNYQRTITNESPAHIRNEIQISLDEIKTPGHYLVEFVGNSLSRKILIIIGNLTYIEKEISSGSVIEVYDEKGNFCKQAKAYINDVEFTSDENGFIFIPHSNATTQSTKIILSANNRVSSASFNHKTASYRLALNVLNDQENLVPSEKCTLAIVPLLTSNGSKIQSSLLSNAQLTIAYEGTRGQPSTQTFEIEKIENNTAITREIVIPDDSYSMHVTLTATINANKTSEEKLTASTTITLYDQRKLNINNVYMVKANNEFYLKVLDLTGLPVPFEMVHIKIQNQAMVTTKNFSYLQTDEKGTIKLGALSGVLSVTTTSGSMTNNFLVENQDSLQSTNRNYTTLSIAEGETILLHQPISDLFPSNKTVFLFEMDKGNYIKNLSSYIKVEDQKIIIKNLPFGEYKLINLRQNLSTNIFVRKNHLHNLKSQDFLTSLHDSSYDIGLKSIHEQTKEITLSLSGDTTKTTAHIFAKKFHTPVRRGYLNDKQNESSTRLKDGENFFIQLKILSEEDQYIYLRNQAKIFAGNMLLAPSILVNPFDTKPSESFHRDLNGGYGTRSGGGRRRAAMHGGGSKSQSGYQFLTNHYKFMKPSFALYNQKVDDKNELKFTIPNADSYASFQVLVHHENEYYLHEFDLGQSSLRSKDLRWKPDLPEKAPLHISYTVKPLRANETTTINQNDVVEHFALASLQDMFDCFYRLNQNPQLEKFHFIKSWNTKTEKEKLQLYEKFSCHELNFFLQQKDKAFFEKSIKPFLAFKKIKTFMDEYFLDLPLQTYFEPEKFYKLNLFEKILLLKKFPEKKSQYIQYIKNNIPEQQNWEQVISRIFHQGQVALNKSSSLDHISPSVVKEKADLPLVGTGVVGNIGGGGGGGGRFGRSAKKIEENKLKSDELDDMEEMMEVKEKALVESASPPMFEELDKTKEYAESNYYQRLRSEHNPEMIPMNPFWLAWVTNDKDHFIPVDFHKSSHSFTECMIVLALIDLPWASDYQENSEDKTLTIQTKENAYILQKIFHKSSLENKNDISVVSKIFEMGNNETEIKPNQLVKNNVYNLSIILTNSSSRQMTFDLQNNIPSGAIPLGTTYYYQSNNISLMPYSTNRLSLTFYFPKDGQFIYHAPTAIINENVVGIGQNITLTVLAQHPEYEKDTWNYISNNADSKAILEFIKTNPNREVDLSRIYYKLREKDFYTNLTDYLSEIGHYDYIVMSFAIYHKDSVRLKRYLSKLDLINYIGGSLSSELLTFNAETTGAFQIKEYWPLITTRAHALNQDPTTENKDLNKHFTTFINHMIYEKEVSPENRISYIIYCLNQNRLDLAFEQFKYLPKSRQGVQLQLDYLTAYLNFYTEELEKSEAIANKYKDISNLFWYKKFNDMLAQIKEIKTGEIPDYEFNEFNKNQKHAINATYLHVTSLNESAELKISTANLDNCTVKLYPIHLEQLFSKSPFATIKNEATLIYPQHEWVASLKNEGEKVSENIIKIPEKFKKQNLYVAVEYQGKTSGVYYYPNNMNIQIAESFGQIKVTDKSGKPLSKVYIKAYTRNKFLKDGYTDLRGRFDYLSTNKQDVNSGEPIAILIHSPEYGSVMRELKAPLK